MVNKYHKLERTTLSTMDLMQLCVVGLGYLQICFAGLLADKLAN